MFKMRSRIRIRVTRLNRHSLPTHHNLRNIKHNRRRQLFRRLTNSRITILRHQTNRHSISLTQGRNPIRTHIIRQSRKRIHPQVVNTRQLSSIQRSTRNQKTSRPSPRPPLNPLASTIRLGLSILSLNRRSTTTFRRPNTNLNRNSHVTTTIRRHHTRLILGLLSLPTRQQLHRIRPFNNPARVRLFHSNSRVTRLPRIRSPMHSPGNHISPNTITKALT